MSPSRSITVRRPAVVCLPQPLRDVSLVDGYNLPMLVETSASGGSTGPVLCAATGCAADLIAMCLAELRARAGAACRSACDVFVRPEYCCSGAGVREVVYASERRSGDNIDKEEERSGGSQPHNPYP
ncbi:hypothetical protein SORBI_3004G100400 [Sorghum bicolor]|uniref:Uncharacterized protein n=1 Tax=Sorghum bicolor TaxID=4558 RepID=A0A194YNT8_SORBI|nr:hypothetical protein SORBI_3004G100400 [Sorghum bicolor]